MTERKTRRTEAEIEQIVLDIVGSNYSEPKIIARGSQGAVVSLKWGPGKTEVVAKIDDVNPENPRAVSCNERGYDSYHELELTQSIPNAEEHGINAPYEYHDRRKDLGVTVLLKRKIEGETLRQRAERQPLDKSALRDLSQRLFETIKHYRSAHIFHRDLNPDNIMLENNGSVEVLDFANGCKEGNIDRRIVTSMGGRAMDPLLLSVEGYREDSETFSLANTLDYAIMKETPFRRNGNGSMVASDTEEVVVSSQGEVNTKTWKARLERFYASFPKDLKKLAKVLSKAQDPTIQGRYTSFDQFTGAVRKAMNKTLMERVNEHWLPIWAGSLITLAAVSGLGTYGYHQMHKREAEVKHKIEQAVANKRIPITPTFDGTKLEFKNPLFQLNFSLTKDKPYELVYDTERKMNPDSSIRLDHVVLERGQKYNIYLRPQILFKLNGGISIFKGRAGIEGFESNKFYSDLIIGDPTKYDMHGPNIPYGIAITIPKDEKEMPDGNYALNVEMYAQDRKDPPNIVSGLSEIEYDYPGRALASRRLNVIVGKPSKKINVSTLSVGAYCTPFISIQTVDDGKIGTNTYAELSLAETGEIIGKEKNLGTIQSSLSPRFRFSPTKDLEDKTLQIVLREDSGNITNTLGCFFFPVAPCKEKWAKNEWEIVPPKPEWYEKLVEYRKKAY